MDGQKEIRISVVVPVFNERANVAPLHAEIAAAVAGLGPYEIIFVDDCSTDGTLEALRGLKPCRILRLRRNSGQSAALDAGIKNSRGGVIVTLDGDGQNDPKEIPALVAALDSGLDAVCGWRHKRKDTFAKRFTSRGAALLRRFLVDDGIHDAGCTLRAYRRECFEDLELYGEMHRMIPALLKWRGFRIGELKVNHRPRTAGKTKYSFMRIPKGLMDMIYVWFWRKYSFRPLHIFGGLGLIFMSAGSLLLALMAYLKLVHGYRLSDKIWPLAGFFAVLVGMQFFITGLLAANIVDSAGKRKYHIAQSIENR